MMIDLIDSDKYWIYSPLKFHKVSTSIDSVCITWTLQWLYWHCFALCPLRFTKKLGFVNTGPCKHQFSHYAQCTWFHSELTNMLTFQWVVLESSETQLNILVPDLRFEPLPGQPKCDPIVSITGTGLGWLLGQSTVCWLLAFVYVHVVIHCCIRVFSVCDKLQIMAGRNGDRPLWKLKVNKDVWLLAALPLSHIAAQ